MLLALLVELALIRRTLRLWLSGEVAHHAPSKGVKLLAHAP
jgi:hypothetical protein